MNMDVVMTIGKKMPDGRWSTVVAARDMLGNLHFGSSVKSDLADAMTVAQLQAQFSARQAMLGVLC